MLAILEAGGDDPPENAGIAWQGMRDSGFFVIHPHMDSFFLRTTKYMCIYIYDHPTVPNDSKFKLAATWAFIVNQWIKRANSDRSCFNVEINNPIHYNSPITPILSLTPIYSLTATALVVSP